MDHGDAKELASVAVKKGFQGKGFGKKIIEDLIKNQNELYLICEGELENFYEKFGFKKIEKNLAKSIFEKLEKEKILFPEDKSIAMFLKK